MHVYEGHCITNSQTKIFKRDVYWTVKDFAQAPFEHVGLNYKDHVEVDKRYQRPTEVDALIGDPSKAEKILGWKAKTHWKELAKLMVDADLEKAKSKSN